MNEYGPTYNEIDGYIAELTEAEREELAMADSAIELAFLFHDARESRGLTQAEAAQQAGLRQQAVSRFEQPDMKLANTKVETLRRYMAALGYSVQITLKDLKSGLVATDVDLPPRPQQTGSYMMMVPGIMWQREPTAAKSAIVAEGFNANAQNAYIPLWPKDTTVLNLFPELASTARRSNLNIDFTRYSQELREMYG